MRSVLSLLYKLKVSHILSGKLSAYEEGLKTGVIDDGQGRMWCK